MARVGALEPISFKNGQDMTDVDPYQTPSAELDGAPGNFARAIGPKNTEYYLRQRERIADGKVSWNWPACLITGYWLLYRKMYLWFFGYIGSSFGLQFALTLSELFLADVLVLVLSILLVLAFFVLPGFYGSALYLRKIHQLTDTAEQTFPNDPEQQGRWLDKRGGTSWLVVGVLLALAILGIVAAIALPAYQEYIQAAEAAKARLEAGGG